MSNLPNPNNMATAEAIPSGGYGTLEDDFKGKASINLASEDLEEREVIGDDTTESLPITHHPLEYSWAFWFNNPSAKSKRHAWGASLRKVHSFSTVEEFWSLYNNIYRQSKLSVGADLYCFKQNIEPTWEDPICANGGKWTIRFPRGKSDTPWLHTLLAMIGEQFDHGDEICGAVINVRGKQEKVSIWTKNAANEAAQASIGKRWKELLDYKESMGFMVHDDAKRLKRNARNRYTVM